MEAKYAEKAERMRRAESEKTWAAISALEDTMRRRLESLTDERRRKFGAAREVFGAAQSKLAHDGKSLGGEASAARTRHGRADARLGEARMRNARLAASLQEAERNLPDLRRRLDGHRRARSRQAVWAAAAAAAARKPPRLRLKGLVVGVSSRLAPPVSNSWRRSWRTWSWSETCSSPPLRR